MSNDFHVKALINAWWTIDSAINILDDLDCSPINNIMISEVFSALYDQREELTKIIIEATGKSPEKARARIVQIASATVDFYMMDDDVERGVLQ